MTLQVVQNGFRSGIFHQLVVAEILLLGFQTTQLLGLFTIVDDAFRNVVANEIIFCTCQNTIEASNLTLKELDDIVGFTETNQLILASEDFIQNVQCIISNTCIVGGITYIDDITFI